MQYNTALLSAGQSVDRLQGNASPLVADKRQRKSQSSGFLHHRPPPGLHGYSNSSISIPAFQVGGRTLAEAGPGWVVW